MPSDDHHDLNRFRKQASELRSLADSIKSPQAKALVLRAVANYERMAEELEEQPKRWYSD